MKEKWNLNKWRDEIHKNSVNHGWWDSETSFAETVALCHSELSEALEADRELDENGNPRELIYFVDGKPEGAAVEMIDVVMRALDWFGKMGIDVDELMASKHCYNITRPYKHGKRY